MAGILTECVWRLRIGEKFAANLVTNTWFLAV